MIVTSRGAPGQVLPVEEDAVVTAPGTLVDALEGEFRIEVDDGVSVGVDLDAGLVRAQGSSWAVRTQVPFPRRRSANDLSCTLATGARTPYT